MNISTTTQTTSHLRANSVSRWRAAGLHLLVCTIVAIFLISLFWFVWYPEPLFDALGVTKIFAMLLAIDVVLGPLLTLIVFKTGKRTLKFDLTVIACAQIAALMYGCHTLWIARPVYIAALGHRYDVVTANDIDADELSASKQALPTLGPVWVGTKLAVDSKEKERVLFSALSGFDYGHYPQHHQPIENMRDEILRNAQSISDLKKLNPAEEAAIDRWLKKHDVNADAVIFQGLKARVIDMAVIMDAKNAKVIGIAPFKPWP
jgi:hypothetical protein